MSSLLWRGVATQAASNKMLRRGKKCKNNRPAARTHGAHARTHARTRHNNAHTRSHVHHRHHHRRRRRRPRRQHQGQHQHSTGTNTTATQRARRATLANAQEAEFLLLLPLQEQLQKLGLGEDVQPAQHLVANHEARPARQLAEQVAFCEDDHSPSSEGSVGRLGWLSVFVVSDHHLPRVQRVLCCGKIPEARKEGMQERRDKLAVPCRASAWAEYKPRRQQAEQW